MKITPRMKSEFERSAGYGIRLESVEVTASGETMFKFHVSSLGRSMTIGSYDAGTPRKAEETAARIGAFASQWADKRMSERDHANVNV